MTGTDAPPGADPADPRAVDIVAGVDGSAGSLYAIRWAAADAARRGARLRLVHACSLPPLRTARSISTPHPYAAEIVEQGYAWLAEARAIARETAPGVEVVEDLRIGGASASLLAAADTARLVAVGSRGLGGFSGLLVGSVAAALASHARCPVVVVRGPSEEEPPPQTGPVVVGVDGSADSERALGFAFATAAEMGEPLVAVHAWTEVGVDGAWSLLAAPADHTKVTEVKRRLLAEQVTAWREKFPAVAVTERVVRDRPVRGLLAVAAELHARLLVVGSRGQGPATGMMLGSTSWSLLHHAECPVAVVRRDVDA